MSSKLKYESIIVIDLEENQLIDWPSNGHGDRLFVASPTQKVTSDMNFNDTHTEYKFQLIL